MTQKDVERSIELLLHQMARLEQLHEESEQRHAKFESSVTRSIESILQQQAKNTSDIVQLTALGAKMAKSQFRTEKQMKAFISALERRFGGNGQG
jgi:uncharacterized membrane protein YccC